MSKIGFATVCHVDYIDDSVHNIVNNTINSIRQMGHTVVSVDMLITNGEEGCEAGKELARNDLDGVIIFLGSWIECPVAMSVIREIEHLPLCLWGFPMFVQDGKLESTGSYVSFTMFKGVLDRIEYKYKAVLGAPNDIDVLNRIDSFCFAAQCKTLMKRSKIGLVGYTSMGIYTGTFDHVFMRVKIGPEIEHIDTYTLVNIAEDTTDNEKLAVIEHFKKLAKIKSNVSQEILNKTAGLYIALKKLITSKKLQGINVKCQYELSKEYKAVPCVPLSVLSDEGVIASCEGDILNTVSMMMLAYLSNDVSTYGDAMNHTNNILKLSSCGFVPFSMGIKGQQVIGNFLPHLGFTGIQNSFVLRPGKVTAMRLIEDKCDYHVLYFTGEGLETELRQEYMPALDIKLDGNINELIKNYSGQHFALCYGDISQRLEVFAKILGIKAIRV